VEQIGPKIYKHMSWTPEMGTKESGLERKWLSMGYTIDKISLFWL
jgi:hypothetical protein